MNTFHLIGTIATIAGLAATAIMAIARIVRGPTILDRMVASDVLLTTLLLAAGADMVIRGHTENIPLMTVIAATAVLATIVVARFVRRPSLERASEAFDAAQTTSPLTPKLSQSSSTNSMTGEDQLND